MDWRLLIGQQTVLDALLSSLEEGTAFLWSLGRVQIWGVSHH